MKGQKAHSLWQVEVVRVQTFQFGRQTLIGKICGYVNFYLFAFLRALMLRDEPICYVMMITPPYLGVLARLVSKFGESTSIRTYPFKSYKGPTPIFAV